MSFSEPLVHKEKINTLLCELFGIDHKNMNLQPERFELIVEAGAFPKMMVTYRIMPTIGTFPDWSAQWNQYTYEMRAIRRSGYDDAGKMKYEEINRPVEE